MQESDEIVTYDVFAPSQWRRRCCSVSERAADRYESDPKSTLNYLGRYIATSGRIWTVSTVQKFILWIGNRRLQRNVLSETSLRGVSISDEPSEAGGSSIEMNEVVARPVPNINAEARP